MRRGYIYIFFVLTSLLCFLVSCPFNPNANVEYKDITITFHSSSISNDTAIQVVTSNRNSVLRSNPFSNYIEFSGHYFLGWNLNENAKSATYSDRGVVNFPSDTDLYAVWYQPTITFKSNYNPLDGYADLVKKQTIPYSPIKAKLERNTFKYPYHRFDGWSTNKTSNSKDYTDEAEISLDRDITLYAIWESLTNPIITFNSNVKDKNSVQTKTQEIVSIDTSFTLEPNTFTQEWYIFKGWSENKNAKQPDYLDSAEILEGINTDITLYAVWEEIPSATITFYKNDGTNNKYTQKVRLNEQAFLEPNQFENEGYIFKGWSTFSDQNIISYLDKSEITLSKSINLFAVWQDAGTVLVTFKANNNTLDETSQLVKIDILTSLKRNNFYYSGHNFLGWNTDPSLTNVLYTDQEEVILDSEIILYAVWEVFDEMLYDADSMLMVDDAGIITGYSYAKPLPSRLVIPSVIRGITVTKIGEMAFSNNNDIRELVIPEQITEIGEVAFASCDNLVSITLHGSLKKIRSGAFAYCTSLRSVRLPVSLNYLGDYAFAYCTDLETLEYEGTELQYKSIDFEKGESNTLFYESKTRQITYLGVAK